METWHKVATFIGGPLLATSLVTAAHAQDSIRQIAADTNELSRSVETTLKTTGRSIEAMSFSLSCGYLWGGSQMQAHVDGCLNAIDKTNVNDAAVDVLRVRIGAVNGSAKQESVFSAPSATTEALDLQALSALSPQADVQTIINLGEECSKDYVATNGNAACLVSTRDEIQRYYNENIRPWYAWHRNLAQEAYDRGLTDSRTLQGAKTVLATGDQRCLASLSVSFTSKGSCLSHMWAVEHLRPNISANITSSRLREYARQYPGDMPLATINNFDPGDLFQNNQWNAITIQNGVNQAGYNALDAANRRIFDQMEAVREQLNTVESAPKSQLDALPRIVPEKGSQILDRGSDDPNLDNMDRLTNDVVAYYKDARSVLRQNEFANMGAIFDVEAACVQADLDLNTQIYGRDDAEKVFLLSQCLVAVVNNLPGYQPERMEFLRQRLKAMNSGTPMIMDQSGSDLQPGLRAD